jgi:uncharacterized protein
MNADPSQTANDPIQDEVFVFLGDSSTYDGLDVRRCDTHAAVVFLAGERALKVKRAVRFPFLDYSTLEKRKAACAAELEVNRRFAPALYRRIVSITREAGGELALDGKGAPVEWAVDMVRFDENQTLDHLADRGALDELLLSKLAVSIAAAHADAPRADAGLWLAALEDYIGQNTAAFRSHGDLFAAGEIDNLERNSRRALDRLRPLLEARGRQGLVRRGHGDLHLGNIAALDGEPIIFDAIEFSPVIASGDMLYDLAFLLMDLAERELKAEANIVLNGYFAAARRIEDCDALAALPFFMSMRAAIRAKVTAARMELASENQRSDIGRSAGRYFQFAQRVLEPATQTIVCTGGLSGTGKSVLARSLAPLLLPLPGALIVRSDVERKVLFGVSETERLPPKAYQAEVTARVYAALNDKAKRIARAGHSVVVDAVFARPLERAGIEAAAREANAALHGLFLTADLQTRLRRVGGRSHDASDADAAVAREQEMFDVSLMNWTAVDASGTPEQTLANARTAVFAGPES